MHPVLEHIFARRGKKVPIDDGRRIALVLFGGNMSSVRGAGAMIALEELGLRHAFDDIFTISAGFANASYLLAGSARLGASIYYEDLIGRQFINIFRPWKVVDIDLLIEVMRVRKPLQVDRILTARTRLHTALYNLDLRTEEYLEVHQYGANEYFKIMKASTSLAFLNPGSVQIGRYRYMDRAYLFRSSLPRHIEYAIRSGATDILVMYNRDTQRIRSFTSHKLFEIFSPRKGHMNRFETNPERLKHEYAQMQTLVLEVFRGQTEGNV